MKDSALQKSAKKPEECPIVGAMLPMMKVSMIGLSILTYCIMKACTMKKSFTRNEQSYETYERIYKLKLQFGIGFELLL